MRISSLCLAVLLFSPVLAHLIEGKNGNTLEDQLSNGTSVSHKKDTVKQLLKIRTESTEIITEDISASVIASKQDWKKKSPNKRRRNRVNQSNQKGRRPNRRNRRPPNKKKTYQKKAKQPGSNAIRYLVRSSHTDELNKAVDDMLAYMSLAIQNSTFTLRLNAFRPNMKISSWAFVVLNKTDTNKMADIVLDRKIRHVRAASDIKSEAAEVDSGESYDDDAINLVEETTLDSVTENSNEVNESSTIPEEVTAIEEDEDSIEAVTYIPVNFTRSEKNNATENHRTQKPSPIVVPDGTVEYNLQLLNGNEIANKEMGFFDDESSEQQKGRQAKKLDGKRDRDLSRNYSRRPNAKVEGVKFIQRNGDVLIGKKQNSTAHIMDIQLLIGPLQCVMDKKAGILLQQSRVSMPKLTAQLRLTEVKGKLVAMQLKPIRIRPNEALVTLRLNENGKVPSHLETARLVSYLSREITRVWNSGYLLRRIKRQFKHLFVEGTAGKGIDSKHEDVRKLVQILAFSAFEEPQSANTEKDSKELSKS